MRNAFLLLIAFGYMFAAPVKKCEELATMPFGADVRIESAKPVAATSNLPEYCDVRGVIWPEARFAVKLPANWNKRFQMVGNGGWAGTINLMAMDKAVHEGYATASTNTGHDQQKEPGLSLDATIRKRELSTVPHSPAPRCIPMLRTAAAMNAWSSWGPGWGQSESPEWATSLHMHLRAASYSR